MIEVRNYQDNIYEFVLPSLVTEDDYVFLLGKMDEFFAKQEKFSLLINLKNLSDIPIKLLKKLALYLNEKELTVNLYLRKTAIYVTHQITRKLIKFFFKIRKPMKPNIVVKEWQKAYQFLIQEEEVNEDPKKSIEKIGNE